MGAVSLLHTTPKDVACRSDKGSMFTINAQKSVAVKQGTKKMFQLEKVSSYCVYSTQNPLLSAVPCGVFPIKTHSKTIHPDKRRQKSYGHTVSAQLYCLLVPIDVIFIAPLRQHARIYTRNRPNLCHRFLFSDIMANFLILFRRGAVCGGWASEGGTCRQMGFPLVPL